MARFRGVGGLTTIVAGQTMFWSYSYGSTGIDVGIAYAAPNLLEGNINVELVEQDQGVTEFNAGETAGLVYTVRIHNNGASEMGYNLNIEDWQ